MINNIGTIHETNNNERELVIGRQLVCKFVYTRSIYKISYQFNGVEHFPLFIDLLYVHLVERQKEHYNSMYNNNKHKLLTLHNVKRIIIA